MARERLPSEPHAGQQESEIGTRHEAVHGRRPAGYLLGNEAERPHAADVRPRERRGEHQPADAGGRDLRMLHGERLHRQAAHRVADQDDVGEVERLEHRAYIGGQVGDGMAGVADGRLTVPAVVERDNTNAGRRQRRELLHPHLRGDRDAMQEDDGRS